MSDAAAPLATSAVLSCRGLTKTYHQGRTPVPVLANLDFDISTGELVSIIGSSGSGKSTFLHLLGGLDAPTSGEVTIQGKRMDGLGEAARSHVRNAALGFVYQFHHLLAEFTALENVAMPLLIRRMPREQALEAAREMLTAVGLAARVMHTPGELSGGERQRAAVARALVTRPACVLADEPTGNLDRQNADAVFDLILELNNRLSTSFIIVTHEPALASRAHRILRLQDGVLGPA